MPTEGDMKRLDDREGQVRHETRSMNARAVVFGMLLLVVLGFTIHFMVRGLLRTLEQGRKPLDRKDNPILTTRPPRRPPDPQLQPDPVGDLHMLRQHEDQILQGYAWVDEKAGKVRIPVARAMQLLAQRGLPNTMGAPPPVGQKPAAPSRPMGAGASR